MPLPLLLPVPVPLVQRSLAAAELLPFALVPFPLRSSSVVLLESVVESSDCGDLRRAPGLPVGSPPPPPPAVAADAATPTVADMAESAGGALGVLLPKEPPPVDLPPRMLPEAAGAAERLDAEEGDVMLPPAATALGRRGCPPTVGAWAPKDCTLERWSSAAASSALRRSSMTRQVSSSGNRSAVSLDTV